MIYRDDYYNPDTWELGIAEINIAKQRAGPTGVAKATFTPKIRPLRQPTPPATPTPSADDPTEGAPSVGAGKGPGWVCELSQPPRRVGGHPQGGIPPASGQPAAT